MANETVQQLRIELRITGLVTGHDGSQLRTLVDIDKAFGDGTAANQVGWVWADDTRALNTTTETLDLDGLADFKGATMSDNANVKVLFVQDLGSTAGQKLTLGGGDWAGTGSMLVDSSDKLNVQAGGFVLAVAPVDGYTITASTGDGLLVESSASMNYRVLLAGDNS